MRTEEAIGYGAVIIGLLIGGFYLSARISYLLDIRRRRRLGPRGRGVLMAEDRPPVDVLPSDEG